MRGVSGVSPAMVTVPASASLNIMTADDSMSDDVFEVDEELLGLKDADDVPGLAPATGEDSTTVAPSPTGYRDYKPPAEVLVDTYSSRDPADRDYKISGSVLKVDTHEDGIAHKTILLGDSGVGKTSILVQFDIGKFQMGNFAATVGIGFTVMLLGDSGVGKTCLLVQFRDGFFLSGNFISTVGIDFRNKVVTVDDTRVKLQIWDTAGQERFRSVTHAYYRDAHALLLLYDVTNKTSFDNIRAWLVEIREYAHEDVVIMLLGNKADCGAERAIKREDGERLAREYKVPFMETSAKTGLNVELAFIAVARDLKARKSGNTDETRFNVQDYVRQQSQRNSCFTSNCLTT
ncbi:ras-related protein Rab-37 isoform X1 [Cephus cinctus]|uniref:small monomeric GTPase n=1 Tax=Cephus cinctus TaxID=211228 RepID=A0AAJ7C6V8_CEPCN|nr:ras-related protein Rab-37 isoform X1 [Cephus cinctus]XP_015603293.1 ras-related protein Rab-37 isoform X1 [Cephus cinctus]XP_015603294.1 ras-related protein Rab-37 isoform X1 [Cephus cinctus]